MARLQQSLDAASSLAFVNISERVADCRTSSEKPAVVRRFFFPTPGRPHRSFCFLTNIRSDSFKAFR
jgi:hypothetical protein